MIQVLCIHPACKPPQPVVAGGLFCIRHLNVKPDTEAQYKAPDREKDGRDSSSGTGDPKIL